MCVQNWLNLCLAPPKQKHEDYRGKSLVNVNVERIAFLWKVTEEKARRLEIVTWISGMAGAVVCVLSEGTMEPLMVGTALLVSSIGIGTLFHNYQPEARQESQSWEGLSQVKKNQIDSQKITNFALDLFNYGDIDVFVKNFFKNGSFVFVNISNQENCYLKVFKTLNDQYRQKRQTVKNSIQFIDAEEESYIQRMTAREKEIISVINEINRDDKFPAEMKKICSYIQNQVTRRFNVAIQMHKERLEFARQTIIHRETQWILYIYTHISNLIVSVNLTHL